MALKKEKTSEIGVLGDYWRIDMLNIDKKRKIANGYLSLYVDSTAASDVCCMPLEAKKFQWTNGSFPFDIVALDENNPYTIAYNLIKASDMTSQVSIEGLSQEDIDALIESGHYDPDFVPTEQNWYADAETV